MCGITGFIQSVDFNLDAATVIATRMADAIVHRGPDDSGVWLDEHAGLALAHQRLSILDLSPAGHQPMMSSGGRYVMVFNGEIYNHQELRLELEKLSQFNASLNDGVSEIHWRGHSDTETLLAAFEVWGIEATLKKTVGMFAIALWDRELNVLTLARDRIGEKPLYYGFQNKTFMFGSELKALKAHPDFLSEIDRDVLCLYLRHCYIPAPFSIYKGIHKLLPGTYVQLNLHSDVELPTLTPKAYWSMEEVAKMGAAYPFQGSDAEAISALDKQLRESIGLQMLADVPLGAFLSGGVDSSTLVALMQAQSDRPIKTFSIGFEEASFNEAGYAKDVAMHLGTDHTELYVSSAEAMEVIPLLGKMYDEPFADSSQIPTYLVSKMAKQHVKVSLSGDAGDELFCGYNRYALADNWSAMKNTPLQFRKIASKAINSIEPKTWDGIFRKISKIKRTPENMGDKLGKLAKVMNRETIQEAYYNLVSEIDNPESIVIGATEPESWLTKIGMKMIFNDSKQRMMFMDAMTYLPDDILVKVDRAAMANSLETRVPFLDHRVVKLAWRLPMNMKMRDGKTKWILRQVLYKYVPQVLIERPKQGFSIPLNEWLRGPLRHWVESLLNEKRLRSEGYFNVSLVRKIWLAHLSGKRNNQRLLWSILMYQAWLAEAK
jgi:asparagine synthase (glutamine-hydrolysing)